ncbi:hypothetical protein IWW50_002364, partial [Coemansia erecta]
SARINRSDSGFYASLLQTAEHIYPLRKRSERNLHPYTKLVWTNPGDLHGRQNSRRDMAVLDSQLRINQEDSEDDDYVPGSPEPADEPSQFASLELGSSQPLLLPPQRGLTYRHMAARRRQRLSGPHRAKQHLQQGRSDSHTQPNIVLTSDHRTSGSGEQTDPYAFPATDERVYRTTSAQLRAGSSSSSSLDDSNEILGGRPWRDQELSAEGIEGGSDDPHVRQHKRRRLLSRHRRVNARSSDGADNDNNSASGDSSADQLPTARARRLDKLSRRQIRGVLPFSFMRDLNRGRHSEIDEELGRWQNRPQRKGPGRQRALSSSPPLVASRAAQRADSDEDMPMADGGWQSAAEPTSSRRPQIGTPADLFSDPVSPAEPAFGDRHQPRFAFNFLDIYEWQFPPLAPSELTGTAPDFLRVAARECRRRGLHAKTRPDDASKKAIVIAPRNTSEAADEDVAQSILMSWNMGVIDVRRVYFDDDADDSDGFEAHQRGADISEDDWPHSVDLGGGFASDGRSPILISDDEAIEDNGTFDRMSAARQSASIRRRRTKQPSAPRRKSHVGSERPRVARPRSARPSLMHRPASEQIVDGRSNENRGLNAVMGEFAAFDSDSDSNGAPTATHLPPLLLDQHMSHMQNKHTRQRLFVDRFNRQPKQRGLPANSSRRSTVSKYGRSSAKRLSHARVSSGRHVLALPVAAPPAEFVFDDHESSAHTASIKPRLQQTRLLTNRPHAGPGVGPSMADAVADRISKRRPAAKPARSSTTTHAQSRTSYSRGIHRKAIPTRVQVAGSGRMATATAAAPVFAAIHTDSDVDENTNIPFAGGGSQQTELRRLESGARFMNNTWVAQGGIRQIRQRLDDTLAGAAREPEQHSYQYGDVLRIDASATPTEFGQALGMLFMLWHEKIVGGANGDDDSVLRWIGFSQQYVAQRPRSAAVLAQVTQTLVRCTRDALPRLEALATAHRGNMALAACVGLSYAVNMLQLAVSLARARSSAGPAGPRAVGEEDDALMDVIGPAELGAEIDRAVMVTIRLLGSSACDARPKLLGAVEQVWLALMHIFAGSEIGEADASGRWAAAVPVRGMWGAVQYVCTHGPDVDRQRARSLWAALALLVQLAQVNIDGVAAPRAPARLHAQLLRLTEAAAERQLLGVNAEALRASDEVAVRQAYFRTHGMIVDHGLSVPASSPLFMTLYRFLENIKFRSLSIEPPPSLPRFFTRYTGAVPPASSASDTCTVLWLRALDVSLGGWLAQLQEWPSTTKQHRRVLRDVRSIVSKMLPTRILTFTPATPATQLSTLANYYAVFLLFLHAVPSHVVRAVRLYTQFQALLRFRDSASQTARRVYFEAWAACVCIVASHLRATLSTCGDVCGVAERLVAGTEVTADVTDYHRALAMAVAGWGESLGIVLAETRAHGPESLQGPQQLWSLVDAAFMYFHRVLTSSALAQHLLTIALLVLELFRVSPVLDLLVWPEGAAHVPTISRIQTIFDIWRASLVVPPPPPEAHSGLSPAVSAMPIEHSPPAAPHTAYQDDSQGYLDMLDSNEMLEAAAAADEMERQAAVTAVNTAIVREIHERYVPSVRLHLVSMFASLGATAYSERALVATTDMLAQMVFVCVDSGLRTWESFLDEHGRDSLHLIPSPSGRRLVLALFTVAAIDAVRKRGQQCTRSVLALAADVWFTCIYDLRLTPYTHRLAAQLQWAESQAESLAGCFAHVPVDRNLIDARGVLRRALGHDAPNSHSASQKLDVYEHRATLAVGCIACVLQSISRSLRAPDVDEHTKNTQKHVFSAWVAQMLNTQRQVHQDCMHASHGLLDIRDLVSSMAERVTLLVRDNCAELFLPPNLVLLNTRD